MVNGDVAAGITPPKTGNDYHGRPRTVRVAGNDHKLAFTLREAPRASHFLSHVHSDVTGPMQIPSIGGARYFIFFIDDRSNWISI